MVQLCKFKLAGLNADGRSGIGLGTGFISCTGGHCWDATIVIVGQVIDEATVRVDSEVVFAVVVVVVVVLIAADGKTADVSARWDST